MSDVVSGPREGEGAEGFSSPDASGTDLVVPARLWGEGLLKVYRKRRVVDDIAISVTQGEIVGLLGPNKFPSSIENDNRSNTTMEFEDVRPFLEDHHRGVIGTRRANGATHSSIVVCGAYRDQAVFVSVRGSSAKVRNIRREPHCTVLAVTDDWRSHPHGNS